MKDQHCIATAEVSRQIGKPATDTRVCKCGHQAYEHHFGLFESPCLHQRTAEEWMDPLCRCKQFEEQR